MHESKLETELPVEAYQVGFEYLKHLTALCTGSILLIVAFLEKLFESPEWKICIAISLVSFLLSVVFAVAGQAGLIEMIDDKKKVASWAGSLWSVGVVGTWISFLVGLTSLLVFALKNLF